jgi:quercetin dioxygenase-like cupin family protein
MTSDNASAIVTELGRWPLDGLAGHEVRLLTVEHPPGVHTPPHRHPGWLVAHVLHGPVVSQMEGEPSRSYQTGEWWFEPSGRLHVDAGNDQPDATTKILVFTVTEADQPVLVPETEARP